MISNRNGLTVPELIEFLQSLPKAEHEDDVGEVWIEEEYNGMSSSSLCYTAHKLNKNDVIFGLDFKMAELIEKYKKEQDENR